MARKVLLVCGILASLLYVATDIAGAMLWEGYSYTGQTISELGAIGAPTRALVLPLFLAYDALVIAFGLGVWESASRRPALRIAGAFLVGLGVIGFVGAFAPMHLRGAEATLTDTLHKAWAAVDVLFILLMIAFGAKAFGKRFSLYSIATMLIVLGFGVWAGLDAPRVEANLPTPWVGLRERISVYSYLLWALALAVGLVRVEATTTKGILGWSRKALRRLTVNDRPQTSN